MDIVYPLLGAIAFAVSSILRKAGLLIDNVPLVAAALTATTALCFSLGLLKLNGGKRIFLVPRRSIRWYLAAGAFNTAAMFSVFYALSSGQVVIVEPIVAANPVVSVILTALFLRDLESISTRVVAGVLCTVAGTILVVTV